MEKINLFQEIEVLYNKKKIKIKTEKNSGF